MIQEWMNDADPEDLAEPYKTFAKQAGTAAALILAEQLGGATHYLPKLDQAMRFHRDRMIRIHYNGYNAKELAKKYDVTDSWVRQLVAANDPNQATMF